MLMLQHYFSTAVSVKRPISINEILQNSIYNMLQHNFNILQPNTYSYQFILGNRVMLIMILYDWTATTDMFL